MFKYDHSQNKVVLCCDMCGQPIDVNTAAFAGPFSADADPQEADSIVILVHNDCETRASSILTAALGLTFGTISAKEPLQAAVAAQ